MNALEEVGYSLGKLTRNKISLCLHPALQMQEDKEASDLYLGRDVPFFPDAFEPQF